MKKFISFILAAVMFALLAIPGFGASFEADSSKGIMSPLIKTELNTSNHPDTTKVYDFNSETMSVFVHAGNSKYNQITRPQWVNGASGQDGDRAAYFKATVNDSFTQNYTLDSGNQLYLVYDTGFADSIINWKGKQVIEFDVKADNTNGRLDFMWWYLWHNSLFQLLGEDGRIKGTSYKYPTGEWFHIKMILQNHVWNVYATDSDGEHHIVDNVAAVGKTHPGNTWSQGSRIAFLFNQPNEVASEDERMGFALDNLHFYRLDPESGSGDISRFVAVTYEEETGEAADELPCNGKIKLDFGNADVSSLCDSQNIVLADMGGNEKDYTYSFENGIYSITPSATLERAAKYKLKISDEIRKLLNPDNPPTGSIIVSVRDDSVGDVNVKKAQLEISGTSAVCKINCETTSAKTVDVYTAIYNYDKTLSTVYPKKVLLKSGETTFETNIDNIDVKLGMYPVCYIWSDIKPLSSPAVPDLPNDLEYGSYIFEAEDIITEYGQSAVLKSDMDASGERAVYFTSHRWDTDALRPASDGTDDALFTNIHIASKEQSGDYALWFRYKTLPNAEGSFIWYRYSDIAYARKHASLTGDGAYRWACINISLYEGDNDLAFSSGVPSYVDKFILTKNKEFVPVGMNDTPPYVTDEILELKWSALWAKPPVAPPEGHPRLYITPDFIPELKENLSSSENGWMYNKFKGFAYEDLNCRLDTSLSNNYNGILLVKIMSRALVYVVGDETDINHAKQTISYMRDYLDTVRTPSDTGDITRTRGDILVGAAVVYDWCYNALSDGDKEYFKDQFVRIAASKEIGWPPKNMSSVASHGGEQEIFRDLLAAGIAIYDEYPLYYNMAAGRMFEEMIPARAWLRNTGRFDMGNDYAECRAYSEMWAGITLKRMGYDISVYGNATAIPLKWLIYSRMPYGAMMPSGDMYTITRSESKYYHLNYMLTWLIASNLYGDSELKHEFLRRFCLGYAGESIQFWYCIFNDPSVGAEVSKDKPLAVHTSYPLSAILHKTSNQEGYDSDAAAAFMNMHEIFVGDHQNIYTGDFQIYYKGLLAMNTGTYNASTQHNEGYKRRAIAGNTMLCYDPNETFVPTWSNVTVPNDGGQRTPYLNENGVSKGSVVGKFTEFETDENGIAQNRDLVVSENVKHYIGPNEKTPLYSYISGDLTNAYSNKVTSYKRSMVFADLANDTYPAAFIVYDKMASANASFKKTFLLHSQQKPSVLDNVITITRTDADFDGKLVDTVLLPEKHTIDVIGDEKNEMFNVGGLLMPPKENTIEGGNYRIELSPVGESVEDEFLNVMYVTDASGNPPALNPKKLETELFVGASICNRVVLFARGDEINSSFNLTIDSDSGTAAVLICGMAEGTWNISGGEISINVSSRSDGNAVFAELPNGAYTVSPTTDEPTAVTYPLLSKRAVGDFDVWKYASKTDGNGSNKGNFLYQPKPTILSGGVPCTALEMLTQFGAEYSRSGAKITITKGGKTASLTVRSTQAVIDAASVKLSKAPFAQNSTVYVPIKDLADVLGYDFSYNSAARVMKANPQ